MRGKRPGDGILYGSQTVNEKKEVEIDQPADDHRYGGRHAARITFEQVKNGGDYTPKRESSREKKEQEKGKKQGERGRN